MPTGEAWLWISCALGGGSGVTTHLQTSPCSRHRSASHSPQAARPVSPARSPARVPPVGRKVVTALHSPSPAQLTRGPQGPTWTQAGRPPLLVALSSLGCDRWPCLLGVRTTGNNGLGNWSHWFPAAQRWWVWPREGAVWRVWPGPAQGRRGWGCHAGCPRPPFPQGRRRWVMDGTRLGELAVFITEHMPANYGQKCAADKSYY